MPSSRFIFGTLPWYSVLIVTGVCLALFLASREEKRLGLPKETVVDLALWVIPAGIIGARLYYVLFAWETFRAHPISILYIWQGGLAIYGAVIGGGLAALLFSHGRKLNPLALLDMIAPGLLLAQAIGRWGNFFNMEAYGLPVTSPAWQFFPAAVRIPSPGGDTWHMATFFYESMWNLAGFGVLMLTRRRMARPGDTTLWYFLLYGSGRLIIEGLRTDSLMATDTLRISQLLSAALCLAAVAVFALRSVKGFPRKRLLSVLLSGAIVVVLTALLARYNAFTGYRLLLPTAALLAHVSGIVLHGSTGKRVALLGPLGVKLNLLLILLLPAAAMPAWAVSTVLAAGLSALLLMAGAGVYAAGASDCTRSSTVS